MARPRGYQLRGHDRAIGAGWGEDASPPSAPSPPPSKLGVSLGVQAKAILLHKCISWLGSMPSPGGTGIPTALVGMTQLTLFPWLLAGPSQDGSTRAEGRSLAPREMRGHPAAPPLWVIPQVPVASPGLSQQGTVPVWGAGRVPILVASGCPSPFMQALQLVLVTHPMACIHPTPCQLAHQHRRCGSC